MTRSSASELPSGTPISPYMSPPNGNHISGAPAPLNYAGQPIPPAPATKTTPTPKGLFNAFKRRWVLGSFLGLTIGITIASALWLVLPGGKHEARGLIDLRDKPFDITNKNIEDYEHYRRNQIFILKTRDLINRTVNDPAVSSLEMIKNTDDPARMVEESLIVTAAAPSILSVTMKGNNVDEMKVIVDSLMKRYVDDATGTDRRERDDHIKKLEKTETDLNGQIESTKQRIRMMSNLGATGVEGSGSTQHLYLQRTIELQKLITEKNNELTQLESELKIAEQQVGWFKISDKSLEDLRKASVPINLVDKLKKLRDQEFHSRKLFVDELGKLFAKDELNQWRTAILNSAQLPNTQQPLIPEGAVVRAINNDSRVVKLTMERAEYQALYEREKENATDPETAPAVLTLAERVQKKEKEIEAKKQEIRNDVVAAVRSSEVARLQLKVNSLEEKIAISREARETWRQELDSNQKTRYGAAGNDSEVTTLRTELLPQQEALEKIRLSLVQLRVQTQLDNRSRIREPAQSLMSTNFKKMLLSSSLGVGSFMFVILLVAFLEWRTRRVDGVDQVVNELGMRIIGTVPVFPSRTNLKTSGEGGAANWRFALNESINSTRTMLLHTARSQSMQVVMVTSATQGEGKTSLTSQLATSMATAGMRTLIVDCDLRNPSIHKLFDLGLSAGVSEILTQEADPAEAIQPTSVPNLWVIPAGQCSNRVVAALAQGHPLETLFNRLRGQFDFVIVDSCPVLPVADALLVGQHVDAVLFSIMQDISQIPKVVLASEKLGQLNIPLLGAVVNGIKQDVYSYGYNYVKQLPA
jgi:succinoglycan biosynthesis transport protein ExoP